MIWMFVVLVTVTLMMGLGVVYLLNKWFRSDLERSTGEISSGAPDSSSAPGVGGLPVRRFNVKLYGPVAVFGFLVILIFESGFYLLNRKFENDNSALVRELKSKNAALETLGYEPWTAKVPVRLQGTSEFDPNKVKVTVKPPWISFPNIDSVPGQKQLTVGQLAVRKPARDNLPTLFVSYPGYIEQPVPLNRKEAVELPQYDTVGSIVTIPETKTLVRESGGAGSEGYNSNGTVKEVNPP